MRGKWLLTLVIAVSIVSLCRSAMAEPQQVIHQFMHDFIHKGREAAEPFLLDTMIKIPELKENTPISGFTVLPTPQREDTKVVVAYFKGEVGGERIAFIWELVAKSDKISHIKVIHDGTNPLLEEAKLIKEYQLKFQRHVFVPSKFPFEISGFDGYMDEPTQTVILNYRNESINGSLSITITPANRELDDFKGVKDHYYTLENGTKVLYNPIHHVAEMIMFQKDGMQYSVSLGNKKYLKKEFTVEDLIQVAESMK